jgi:hypothetical protein
VGIDFFGVVIEHVLRARGHAHGCAIPIEIDNADVTGGEKIHPHFPHHAVDRRAADAQIDFGGIVVHDGAHRIGDDHVRVACGHPSRDPVAETRIVGDISPADRDVTKCAGAKGHNQNSSESLKENGCSAEFIRAVALKKCHPIRILDTGEHHGITRRYIAYRPQIEKPMHEIRLAEHPHRPGVGIVPKADEMHAGFETHGGKPLQSFALFVYYQFLTICQVQKTITSPFDA